MNNGKVETTALMDANDVVMAFNTVTDRKGWKAVIAGARVAPQVKFTSQSQMVEVYLHTTTSRVSVTFTKMACAWGDYIGAARRGLFAVLTALKAAGYPVAAPLSEDDGTMRMEYDLASKLTYIWLANLDDDWTQYEDKPFKALEGVL